MSNPSRLSLDNLWKVLLLITLLFFGLIHASSILVPLVFSLFIAIMLNPLVSFLERKGFNSVLAIITTLLVVGISLVLGVYYVSIQAKNLIVDLPNLVSKFNLLIEDVGRRLSSLTGYSTADQIQLIKQNADEIISSGSGIISNTVSVTTDFITFITLAPIYIFFFLLYRSNFKKFLKSFEKGNKSEAVKMAEEVNEMVHAYTIGLLMVVSIIAVLNTVGLLALGIKYAVFLGVLSAVLTVIPYIGIIIGATIPVLVALITKDSLFYPLGVIAIFSFVQFLEGNLITPKIVGSKVNVNPMAAIVALLIGGKVWGIIGMVIAIPITGIMKIIFCHYPKLQPYAILLQSTNKDEEKDMSKLKKRKRGKNKSKKTIEKVD